MHPSILVALLAAALSTACSTRTTVSGWVASPLPEPRFKKDLELKGLLP
jgi:hypothetical protein